MVEIEQNIQDMFEAGVHYGYSKTRRHPSLVKHIFGTKNRSDIINLENTSEQIKAAREFFVEQIKRGKSILFVGSKPEASGIIKNLADTLNMPYVIDRWLGGTMTNLDEIKGRISEYEKLKVQFEKGEIDKYTKKEQLTLKRKMDKMYINFGGLVRMKKLPDVLFVIDARHEHIAVAEAKKAGVPVIAICNSDCNITDIDYPIVANDSALSSIKYCTDQFLNLE